MDGETYAAEVFVQELHIPVDQLQRDKLIVLALDGTAEVEAGISEGRGTGGMAGTAAGAAGAALGPRHFVPKPLISPHSQSVPLLDTGGVAPGYANSNSLCLSQMQAGTQALSLSTSDLFSLTQQKPEP